MSIPKPNGLLHLAVFISGGGTTLKNLMEKTATGQLNAEIQLVISSSSSSRGLRFAEQGGISHHVIRPKDFTSRDDYSEVMFELCRTARVDLVVLGGFLKQIAVPDDYRHRVVNVHPALIPAFCGKGLYGRFVHEAVLKYGVKLTGCTVHFVDNKYDHGPVILQKTIMVEDDDTPEMLAARVFAIECEALPEALQLIATGRISLAGRRVQIAPESLE